MLEDEKVTIAILSSILFVLLAYPVFNIFQLEQVMTQGAEQEIVEKRLVNYQLSVWIYWLVFVCFAIHQKWTKKRNFFFYYLYAFLLIAFGIFGYYFQKVISNYNIETAYRDPYTLGVVMALQNLLAAAVLMGILQAGVWWFTRRWHRK